MKKKPLKVGNPKSNQSPDVELAKKQNYGFVGVWNGQKQSDMSEFINRNPSTPRLTFCKTIDEQVIKEQKSGSQGPDGLSPTIIKSARMELASVITVLLNMCIMLRFVSTHWKYANITPIPKIDHPREPGDYRSHLS